MSMSSKDMKYLKHRNDTDLIFQFYVSSRRVHNHRTYRCVIGPIYLCEEILVVFNHFKVHKNIYLENVRHVLHKIKIKMMRYSLLHTLCGISMEASLFIHCMSIISENLQMEDFHCDSASFITKKSCLYKNLN